MSERKRVVIANPRAGSASDLSAIEERLRAMPNAELWITEFRGHATELARRAADQEAALVVAVGGDGTIHEVVNGLAPDFSRTILGVVPMGTGNDLCRTLGVPRDPFEALDGLEEEHERLLDLIEVELETGDRLLAVNAVAGGFSGQVTENLTSDLKERFGPFAFLIGAGEAAGNVISYRAQLELDGSPREEAAALAIIVANGRTAAGGIQIAPGASPEDGLLDVLLLRNGNALELAGLAARIITGDILESGLVVYEPVKEVRLSTAPEMPFNADGELLESAPRRIRVVSGQLRVRAGTT